MRLKVEWSFCRAGRRGAAAARAGMRAGQPGQVVRCLGTPGWADSEAMRRAMVAQALPAGGTVAPHPRHLAAAWLEPLVAQRTGKHRQAWTGATGIVIAFFTPKKVRF